MVKTLNESNNDDTSKYRQSLVSTFHQICLKYPDLLITARLLAPFFELMGTDDEPTANLVLAFIRECIVKNPVHKNFLVLKILEIFDSIHNPGVHCGLIWMLGEFCEASNPSLIQEAMTTIRNSLGDIPIVESELKKLKAKEIESEENCHSSSHSGPFKLVTADGSYATQSALIIPSKNGEKSNIPTLRSYFLTGVFFVGTSLANCLTKLAFKFKEAKMSSSPENFKLVNSFIAECMLILTSILHLGKANLALEDDTPNVINEDDFERIALCLMIMSYINNEGSSSHLSSLMEHLFVNEMRSSLGLMLSSSINECEEMRKKKKEKKCVESDDHLNFSQLISKNQEMFENQFELSLSQAIGNNAGATATSTNYGKVAGIANLLSASKLSKVTQLTGFSDPVYSECYVNVNQYDIALDVLIVNQTNDVLQNCTLELSTLGDLKLVEKPQPIVLAPHDFDNIKATVKVASTENGIIFGNIGMYLFKFSTNFQLGIYL